MDILKREEEIRNAEDVSRLKDRFLDKFFKDQTEAIFHAIRNTAVGDTETLVNLHMGLKSLEALENKVIEALDSGKMARQTLDDARK